jgi:hypothetical protein
MATIPPPIFLPRSIGPTIAPSSFKTISAVAAIGIVAATALVWYSQKWLRQGCVVVLCDYFHAYPLYQRKIIVKGIGYTLKVVGFFIVSSSLRLLIAGYCPGVLSLHIFQQVSYSAVTKVGLAVITGWQILTTFFKVKITFDPLGIWTNRDRSKNPHHSSWSSDPSFSELLDRMDSQTAPSSNLSKGLSRRVPHQNQDGSQQALVPFSKGSSPTIRRKPVRKPNIIPPSNFFRWPEVPPELWTKILPRVLLGQENFEMFYALLLVCKTWNRALCSPECLASEDVPRPLNITFGHTKFDHAEKIAFFDKYLPSKEHYKGRGLWFAPWLTSNQLIYVAERFPEASLESTELYLRADDDVERTGRALSSLLQAGAIKELTITPDQDSQPFPQSFIGKILNKTEKRELRSHARSYLEGFTVFPSYSQKLVELLQHIKGTVVSLQLYGIQDDPSQCTAAMQNLQVANLHFSTTRYGVDPSDTSDAESFQEGSFKQLTFYCVREGTMVTNTLKMTPQVKTLRLGQDPLATAEEVKGEDSLQGLSLANVSLEHLEIIGIDSKVTHSELKGILKGQSCLKDLTLRLPQCKLLSTTFTGLPLERLNLIYTERVSNEEALTGALASVKTTLRELSLCMMTFTGTCLQGLKLQKLRLQEIGQIDETALRQALLGHHLKVLYLSDVDITGACLEGLEVESLALVEEMPSLDQDRLYHILIGMKERGLKKLLINCYRGFGTMTRSELKSYEEQKYYLSDFVEQLKKDPEFAEVEFCSRNLKLCFNPYKLSKC